MSTYYRRYDGPAEVVLLLVGLAGASLFTGAWSALALYGPRPELGAIWVAGGSLWMLAAVGATLLLLDRRLRRALHESRRPVLVDVDRALAEAEARP
ncbi:MAG TPA: hypothetical protein VGS23_07270 [Thermoplasmata archaeon]|nr:hypothetical protein [Thermoplasmata archaeon]